MPARSKVETLPREIRAWLDRALAEKGFAQYEALSKALGEKGFTISKSALHRHGEKLERRLAAVKASTEASRAIAEAIPDDADQRSQAVMSMLQTDLFNSLVDLQEAEDMDPGEKLVMLSKVGRTLAPMVQASIRLKKFAEDVATRARVAADKAEKIATKGGLSKDAAAEIRRSILGIAA